MVAIQTDDKIINPNSTQYGIAEPSAYGIQTPGVTAATQSVGTPGGIGAMANPGFQWDGTRGMYVASGDTTLGGQNYGVGSGLTAEQYNSLNQDKSTSPGIMDYSKLAIGGLGLIANAHFADKNYRLQKDAQSYAKKRDKAADNRKAAFARGVGGKY